MDRRGNVRIIERPKLRHPYLVCGISGWVDGGEAATGSIQYLVSKLEARKFAERHSWDNITDEFEGILKEAISENGK